jgi:N-methylhydantoinase A
VIRVVHGTTLATNAVIERRGARTAFVTTAGFGDLLRIGRSARVEEDRYDLHFAQPEPPLPRERIFEVDERLDAQGRVVRALDDAAARVVAARVAEQAPEAVAVCLLHAYANPEHEERLRRELEALLPDAHIVLSSRVHPEIREYDRACTTLFTAEVAPLMASYLRRLGEGLRALGIAAPLQVMESSGGVMAAEMAAERAIATLESGGAAGVMAAARFARHHELERVISFDMGGTTVKAGVVHAGEPRLARELQVGGKGSFGGRRAGSGMPVKTPTVDIAELGAGGGSIAWLDAEGLLQVGPRSAGADPGPVCYGRGGRSPTVTDANLILGYLDPDRFGSGALKLDAAAARAVLQEQIADPLGVDVESAAWAIHDATNAALAGAIHVVTVQRGLDPREHTLIGFGGAGPMHMAGVADRFDIRRAIVPPEAGVAAAVGMQGSDLRVEFGRSQLLAPEALTPAEAAVRFAELEASALERMGYATAPAGLEIERLVDARFDGQAHELSVPLAALDEAGLEAVDGSFREQYRSAYGVEARGAVEYAALRVRLRVPVEPPPLPAAPGRGTAPPRSKRRVRFADRQLEAAIHDREALGDGAGVEGPAVVEGRVETIVVPPGWLAHVDATGSITLER